MNLAVQSILLSPGSRRTAGVLLLTVVFVEYGGWYLLSVVRGRHQLTDFQRAFSRAGHAHAGVLVTLALVCLVLADATDLAGLQGVAARNGIWLSAILVPAGFFFSSAGRDVNQPNGLSVLVYAGMASLGLGVVCLGLGLL